MNVLLGNPYEELVGFSRAVRVGPFVSVGGTAPIGEDGETVGVGDAGAQARRCFEIVQIALERAGASMADVVRTRMMLTDVSDFEAVVAVRKEFVGEFKPVDTIVEVSRFVNSEWLIEIEADAVLPE
ncbi:MAG: RidA family protein [Acidimicrobiia bacterium]|nr:RidA family protein [Acidimicrobiia bacterium]MBT8192756.1 RidA family protein [Acidimicrobiia bacterium]NNF88009.1 RidA family protein [Acidimicrobiia bacterium]NNL12713.1 RidA family protein [Acidimicrobiia bacterium]NNL97508.1 RidA family protein [Acidimicrobiia bacterium]